MDSVILRPMTLHSPASLRTCCRTCVVPRRALFRSSTSLIVPSIWTSQPGNLSAIAPSAPTTTEITMILTFHSCPWHCDVNYETVCFFIVNQHKVRPKLKQMLVGLYGEVPADLNAIVPDYSFWLYLSVFTVLKVVLSTYGPVHFRGHIVVSQCTQFLKACYRCWWSAMVSACCLHNLHLGSCPVW